MNFGAKIIKIRSVRGWLNGEFSGRAEFRPGFPGFILRLGRFIPGRDFTPVWTEILIPRWNLPGQSWNNFNSGWNSARAEKLPM